MESKSFDKSLHGFSIPIIFFILKYTFLAFSTSTDVAKLLHILIKLTHVHVLTIKHHMVQ